MLIETFVRPLLGELVARNAAFPVTLRNTVVLTIIQHIVERGRGGSPMESQSPDGRRTFVAYRTHAFLTCWRLPRLETIWAILGLMGWTPLAAACGAIRANPVRLDVLCSLRSLPMRIK